MTVAGLAEIGPAVIGPKGENRMFGFHSRSGSGRRLRLWLGVATAGILLTAAAPAQAKPFVYVTNVFSGTVSQYGVNTSGLLAPLVPPTAGAGTGPRGVATSPDGTSVYVPNEVSNSVSQYSVQVGGTLTAKSPPAVAAGTYPYFVAVSPDGHSVYVTNSGTGSGTGSVSQYTVGAGGALSKKTPAAVAAAGFPFGVAVSPDGDSVYVASVGTDTISQYDVGAGGALTPKSPPVVPTGNSPVGVAVSPNGRSVYVTNGGPGTISQYDVGAGGALTPKSPPTVTTAGASPIGLAVSPDGGSVYAANAGSGTGTVAQYDVTPGGALIPKSPAIVAAGGMGPTWVAVSPDGNSVYVTDQEDDTVSQYNVGAGGALSAKNPPVVATGGTPYAVAAISRTPGWEGRVTNQASGCSARVQVPYLDGKQVTAYTEVSCPRPTRLTIRSRLRSDYPSADITVAQRGCVNGCVVDEPKGDRFFRLTCPKSGNARHNQRYYTDIILYPGTNIGAATTERSRDKSLSPFCAH